MPEVLTKYPCMRKPFSGPCGGCVACDANMQITRLTHDRDLLREDRSVALAKLARAQSERDTARAERDAATRQRNDAREQLHERDLALSAIDQEANNLREIMERFRRMAYLPRGTPPPLIADHYDTVLRSHRKAAAEKGGSENG